MPKKDELPKDLRRTKKTQPEPEDDEKPNTPASVSAGPIDKIIELAFNPSDEKLREATVIDRVQGRLLPSLDILEEEWRYLIEVTEFRKNPAAYYIRYKREEPVQPNLMALFIKRTAQWAKSIAGTNLKSLIDLSLADIESRGTDGDDEEPEVPAWD